MSIFRAVAIHVCVWLWCSISGAYAQQSDIPDEVTHKLNKNLEELHEIARQVYSAYESEKPSASKKTLAGDLSALEVTSQASLKDGASLSSKTLGIAEPGTKLSVIGQAGEWFAVDLSQKNPLVKSSEKKAAWISAKNVTPQIVSKTQSVGFIEDLHKKLLDKVFEIRKEFQNNPYVRVSGFSVSTTPPSLTMNFEFK
jgi:hypothetical protein